MPKQSFITWEGFNELMLDEEETEFHEEVYNEFELPEEIQSCDDPETINREYYKMYLAEAKEQQLITGSEYQDFMAALDFEKEEAALDAAEDEDPADSGDFESEDDGGDFMDEGEETENDDDFFETTPPPEPAVPGKPKPKRASSKKADTSSPEPRKTDKVAKTGETVAYQTAQGNADVQGLKETVEKLAVAQKMLGRMVADLNVGIMQAVTKFVDAMESTQTMHGSVSATAGEPKKPAKVEQSEKAPATDSRLPKKRTTTANRTPAKTKSQHIEKLPGESRTAALFRVTGNPFKEGTIGHLIFRILKKGATPDKMREIVREKFPNTAEVTFNKYISDIRSGYPARGGLPITLTSTRSGRLKIVFKEEE